MFVYFLASVMALIIGHSQVKYFNQYVQDNRIKCYYSSGCKVEDLLTFPTIQEVIPAASVSIDLPFHSILYYIDKTHEKYLSKPHINNLMAACEISPEL